MSNFDKNKTKTEKLEVRKIPFDFDAVSNPIWNEKKPEWSHMVNGASLAMPYLEPFLIKSVREGIEFVKSEKLKADVQGFISQEGQHYQNHRRYNDMLKDNGYEMLSEVEEDMAKDYKRFQKKSLKWRLAYTAGFETMTIGVTEWLIENRQELFADADPTVSSLILWHMVEESEHKNVALDLYNELYGKDYLMRLYGLFTGSFHLMMMSRRAYVLMLKRDGLWYSFKSRKRLMSMIFKFAKNVLPAMFRAAAPKYHPSKIKDPDWVKKWGHAYAALPEGLMPLLDTRDSDIPPKFFD
jgi:predicted metal-dependent hydrolase